MLTSDRMWATVYAREACLESCPLHGPRPLLEAYWMQEEVPASLSSALSDLKANPWRHTVARPHAAAALFMRLCEPCSVLQVAHSQYVGLKLGIRYRERGAGEGHQKRVTRAARHFFSGGAPLCSASS